MCYSATDKLITGLLYVFFRHLSSCGILDTRPASLPPPTASFQVVPTRNFINLSAPLITRRMEYSESRALGYVHSKNTKLKLKFILFKHDHKRKNIVLPATRLSRCTTL